MSTIRWVIVPDDTPALPFETVINNSQLDYDRNLNADIGELHDGWIAWDWKKYPPGLYTGHYCGEKCDFQNGGLRDATQPVVSYGSFGFPLCCNPPRNCRGGLGAGGLARLVRFRTVAPGITCSAPGLLSVGVNYVLQTPPTTFAPSYFWEWPITVGKTYRMTTSVLASPSSLFQVLVDGGTNDVCAGGYGPTFGTTRDVTATFGNRMGLEVSDALTGGHQISFTFRVDEL